MTTSVKAKFRPSRVKGKTGAVYFQVIHDRMARQISTGYKLSPKNGKMENWHSLNKIRNAVAIWRK